jgi:uncharacterized Tic20 family protein
LGFFGDWKWVVRLGDCSTSEIFPPVLRWRLYSQVSIFSFLCFFLLLAGCWCVRICVWCAIRICLVAALCIVLQIVQCSLISLLWTRPEIFHASFASRYVVGQVRRTLCCVRKAVGNER